MRIGIFPVVGVFLVLSGCSSVEAQMRKGPCLVYPGVAGEMEIRWQVDSTQNCTLAWGRDLSYSDGAVPTTEYGSDHQHTHTLSSLLPGTKYYYRVTDGLSNEHMGDFISAPLPSSWNVKFLAYGDTRTYPADHNAVCAAMLSAIATDSGYQTFLLHAADWTSNSEESEWDSQFFTVASASARELMSRVPIQGCIGNHEDNKVVFEKYWSYPYWDDPGRAYTGSFDYGPAHVAVIRIEDESWSFDPMDSQYDWLVQDLSDSNAAWKFVIMHAPAYSAGGGHDDNSEAQTYLQPLCEEYGVDIVFAGHNHYYARCEVNDVHHVTTGGGGAPLRTPNTLAPAKPLAAAEAHHYCEVDIQDYRLGLTAKAKDGTVLEQFTIYHPIPGDADGNNVVNMADVGVQSNAWLRDDCNASNNWCDRADVDEQGRVNFVDYSHLAARWGEEIARIVEVTVAASSDDAEEQNSDGKVEVSSTDLELIKESGEQTVGIRFADVPIAKDSSVASAYIQFSVDEMNDENPCSLTIRAEAADDAGTFTGTDHNISSRPTTGASVVWNPAAWHIAGAKGPSQRTSDIADVIEEVIGRTGWSSGNALVIIITGTGRRTAESYDGANGAAAMLHVELAD